MDASSLVPFFSRALNLQSESKMQISNNSSKVVVPIKGQMWKKSGQLKYLPSTPSDTAPLERLVPAEERKFVSTNNQVRVKCVIGSYTKVFHLLRPLSAGNQGTAFLALPLNTIPKKPTKEWVAQDYDDIRHSLRVIKRFHQRSRHPNARDEIEVLKTPVAQSLRYSARLTSYSNDYTWYAQTWSGITLDEILDNKDRIGWSIPNRFCWEILRQGLRALAHLHAGTNGVCAISHNDLVGSNTCLQVIRGEESSVGKPRIHVNFIDFGWSEQFEKTELLHHCNNWKRDLSTFAELIHCFMHPYNYLFRKDEGWSPVWNEEVSSYCSCNKLVNKLASPYRKAFHENHDRDLQFLLDRICDPCEPLQLTANEALQYLERHYEGKFDSDYEIPSVISHLIYAKTPSNKEIKNVVDSGRASGKIAPPPRFPYVARRLPTKPPPRNDIRPRVYLPLQSENEPTSPTGQRSLGQRGELKRKIERADKDSTKTEYAGRVNKAPYSKKVRTTI